MDVAAVENVANPPNVAAPPNVEVVETANVFVLTFVAVIPPLCVVSPVNVVVPLTDNVLLNVVAPVALIVVELIPALNVGATRVVMLLKLASPVLVICHEAELPIVTIATLLFTTDKYG